MDTIHTAARVAQLNHTSAPHGMEHRWGRRNPCRASVRLTAGAGSTGFGRMRDVSMSGAFIETGVALPLHAPVRLAVQHDDGSTGTVMCGCVVRRDADGVGIEWTDTPTGAICPLLDCAEPCARAHHGHR